MNGLLLIGVVAGGWFLLNVPEMTGEFGPLAVILVGPYGLLAVVAVGAWWGRRRAATWAAPLAWVSVILALLLAVFEAIQYWPGLVVSLTALDVSYNWAIPQVWLPIPLLLGAGWTLRALTRARLPGGV